MIVMAKDEEVTLSEDKEKPKYQYVNFELSLCRTAWYVGFFLMILLTLFCDIATATHISVMAAALRKCVKYGYEKAYPLVLKVRTT